MVPDKAIVKPFGGAMMVGSAAPYLVVEGHGRVVRDAAIHRYTSTV